MMIHKPSPSLDKFVIDMCSKSLLIALKVHWFLLAELEDSDDNDGIGRIQDKCQIAATLMGEWPPLLRPRNESSSPGSKNQVLSRILSSKQKLLSLTSSPPPQKSLSFSPSPGNGLQEDGTGSQLSPDENKIFKKFIPGSKVRDALLFRKSFDKDDQKVKDAMLLRKSVDKDEEEGEKDGFFKRLMRDSSKREDEELTRSSDGFFKRLRDSIKSEDEEMTSGTDGFFKRLLKDSSRGEDEEVTLSSDGFFKKLFRDSKGDTDDKLVSKSPEDDEKEGFLKKFLKEKFEDKKVGNDQNEDEERSKLEEKGSKSAEDDEKEGFFQKLFRDKSEDKKDETEKSDEGATNFEEEEPSDFSLFRRLFRVHPEEVKNTGANENNSSGSLFESSPGTESFFRKLFRDRERSVEDSELFSFKKNKELLVLDVLLTLFQYLACNRSHRLLTSVAGGLSPSKHPGSQNQQNGKLNTKPPLLKNTASQFRKGAYHESLDFVMSLCETSYGLVDVFPIEDRKSALCESLAEINVHIAEAKNSGVSKIGLTNCGKVILILGRFQGMRQNT
ncbi:hypothetical protein OIU78_021061 [Salix suchowensis]|nr:hypothetical protein OIU78_021061 [Salix suchowensis]